MNCKGCRTKIYTKKFKKITTCIIQANAPKRKCPCQVCIIKPMCSEQCKPFYDLIESIFKISISYNYKSEALSPFPFAQNRPYYNRIQPTT